MIENENIVVTTKQNCPMNSHYVWYYHYCYCSCTTTIGQKMTIMIMLYYMYVCIGTKCPKLRYFLGFFSVLFTPYKQYAQCTHIIHCSSIESTHRKWTRRQEWPIKRDIIITIMKHYRWLNDHPDSSPRCNISFFVSLSVLFFGFLFFPPLLYWDIFYVRV